jgi:hypothetical protein
MLGWEARYALVRGVYDVGFFLVFVAVILFSR